MGVIAKQSIRGTAVTYLGVFVGFLTTFFVLTRFLSTEEIGLARVLVDASTLFIALAQLGTTSSIIRFYPYFTEHGEHTSAGTTDEHGFFFWTILVPLIGFVLFAGLFCALHGPLSHYFGEKSQLFVDYYYFVLPLAFFMLYQTVFETNAIVRMRIVFPRAVRELFTRIGLLAVYLLYAFRVVNLTGFVVSLCAVYAIAMLLNIIYLFSFGSISLKPDIDYLRTHRSVVRDYLTYTAFLVLSSLATVLAPYLSSFIISARQGLSQTGIFAIATYIAVMVNIPSRSVTAIASPQLSEALKQGDKGQVSRLMQQVSNTLFLVGSVILLAIYINIDLIFEVLPNGEVYAPAKNCVLLLGVSQLLIATFNISVLALNYSKYYYFSLLLSLGLTLGAIVLNNTLIPSYGIDGAAVANVVVYALYYVLVLITMRLCTGTIAISRAMGKTLLTVGIAGVLNYIWTKQFVLFNVWADSIVRTLVLMTAVCMIAFWWGISPDINHEIRRRIRKEV